MRKKIDAGDVIAVILIFVIAWLILFVGAGLGLKEKTSGAPDKNKTEKK